MVRIFAIIMVCCLCGNSFAQTLAVQVECLVFDGRLSESEQSALDESLKKLSKEEREEKLADLTIAALKESRKLLASTSVHVQMDANQLVAHSSSDRYLKAAFKIETRDATEDGCLANIRCAAKCQRRGGELIWVGMKGGLRNFTFGRPELSGGAATDDIQIVFVSQINKANANGLKFPGEELFTEITEATAKATRN